MFTPTLADASKTYGLSLFSKQRPIGMNNNIFPIEELQTTQDLAVGYTGQRTSANMAVALCDRIEPRTWRV